MQSGDFRVLARYLVQMYMRRSDNNLKTREVMNLNSLLRIKVLEKSEDPVAQGGRIIQLPKY